MNCSDELYSSYPCLEVCRSQISQAIEMIVVSYRAGGKLLLAGNGGSSADCAHIAGELMKSFRLPRRMTPSDKAAFVTACPDDAEYFSQRLERGIPAIPLCGLDSVLSAFANDADPKLAYAQTVYVLARSGDLFMGISTSGNSANIVYAAETARACGIPSIALTGARESRLSAICDCTVKVPETEVYKVQELHLPVYHHICAAVENQLFAVRGE